MIHPPHVHDSPGDDERARARYLSRLWHRLSDVLAWRVVGMTYVLATQPLCRGLAAKAQRIARRAVRAHERACSAQWRAGLRVQVDYTQVGDDDGNP